MIKSIKLSDDLHCFFKNQKFIFKEINLLVGDQGSGKSTLMDLIFSFIKNPNRNSSSIKVDIEAGITNYFYFDLERDNPRHQQGNPDSSNDMLYKLTVKSQSHGEVLLPLLREIKKMSNTYIFLDEPESSLSLRSQYEFIQILKDALTRNNQIFIATHNIVFMEAFKDNLISLEELKEVTLDDFKRSQTVSSKFKEIRDNKIITKTKCSMGLECKCANETSWYNNSCENYIGRDGKRNGNKYKQMKG